MKINCIARHAQKEGGMNRERQLDLVIGAVVFVIAVLYAVAIGRIYS